MNLSRPASRGIRAPRGYSSWGCPAVGADPAAWAAEGLG